MNFVFDKFVGKEPIPNGLESKKLIDLYLNDRYAFHKSTPLEFPTTLKYFKQAKFKKLDENSTGIYPIHIFWPVVIHPTFLYYIFNYCISDLAVEKIHIGDLKLIILLDKEPCFESHLMDLYDFLNRKFSDFIIYSFFKPHNDDQLFQSRIRYNVRYELLHNQNKNMYGKVSNKINLKHRLKFSVLGYTRHSNPDFRIFAIDTLLAKNFHHNAIITFDKSAQFLYDITKNSKILKAQSKKQNFDTKKYDVCYRCCDMKDIKKFTDLLFVFGACLDDKYSDWPIVCDKLLKPVSVKMPFVVLGQHNLLNQFRKLGYKSFHPYINESYDNIKNNDKRMIEVIKEVLRISNLPENQYNDLLKKLKPIAEYNYKNMLNRIEKEANFLESFYND